MKIILSTFLCLSAAWAFAQEGQDPQAKSSGQSALLETFASQGVRVDLENKLIEVDAFICQRDEPLEYLYIDQPRGKDHEALIYSRGVSAETLNAAMLMLGVQEGQNGKVILVDPQPTPEQAQKGAPRYTFEPASGDGFYLYVSWEILGKDGTIEKHCVRAEDLVLNHRTEQTYKRGRWVYLGSRFLKPHSKAKEVFAAAAEGNYVSLVNFSPANHLLMGADPLSEDQTVWFPNLYLLPPLNHPVKLLFAHQPFERLVPTLSDD